MDEISPQADRNRPADADAFRVGEWLVEPPLNRVTLGDRSIHVRRQLIDLLVFLARRPGQVVSKEEIFQAVWPGQFVAETGLARCISQLRDVFGDDPREPRFVETIPTRGYRLVAPVSAVAAVPLQPQAIPAGDSVESSGSATSPLPEDTRPPSLLPGGDTGPPSSAVELPRTAGSMNATKAGIAARRWWAIAALAALVLGMGAFEAWRFLRPARLGEQDSVLVSFENHTGDAVFDDTLRLALTVQLEQSPYLRVLPEERVREELGFMNRPADTPVTHGVAMELCQRVGARVVLTGSIAAMGGHYVIGIEGAECPSGRALARRQLEVGRKEAVLASLGEAVSDIRRRLGESVASIQRHDVPLVQATTASLDALKALSAGDRERSLGRDAEAVQAYLLAIEADPGFALAHGRLGVQLLSLARVGEATAALKQAFQLRERASTGERLYITSYYYTRVVRDPVKAVQALEAWRDTYPRNPTPRVSLAEMYTSIGRFDAALAEGQQALRLSPGDATATAVVVDALIGLERLDEAKRLAEALVTAGRGNVGTRLSLQLIAFAQDDAAGVRRHSEWAATNPAAESSFATNRAAMAMFGGRMREGRSFWLLRAERADARGDHALAALTTAGAAFHAAFVGAGSEVQELRAAALRDAQTPDTVLRVALALALVGDADGAERHLAEYERMPDVEAGSDPQYRAPTYALIDIARGRPDAAIERLASVQPYEIGFACIPTYVRGLAHMRARRFREAALEFGTITAHRGPLADALIYPLAWLQLGRARAAASDAPAARQAYDRFLTYWKDADPDVPVLVAARAERAALAR